MKRPVRGSAEPDETFDGTWPFRARYSYASDFGMHYVDEGEGQPVLALHGEPTWGYMFRSLIKALSPLHRVVVPDHMGFGKSETPQDRNYHLQDHIDNLERFVLDLDLKNITLVMHDFGGPCGMGLAIRHPERIQRMISTNGPTPLGQAGLGESIAKNASTSPWFTWVAQAHEEGTLEQVLSQLNYNILSTLKFNGFERNEVITDTWLDAYRAPFPTPQACRGAIGWAKGFAEGAHVFEPVDPVAAKSVSGKPALAIWGMADRTLRAEHFLALFSEAFPRGTIRRLESAGHYCHEDAPDDLSRIIIRFMQRT